MRIQWDYGFEEAKKWALTKNRIYQHFNLGLSFLQNYKKYMCVVQVTYFYEILQ